VTKVGFIKTNPVVPFYTKLDFLQFGEDELFYKFEWF